MRRTLEGALRYTGAVDTDAIHSRERDMTLVEDTRLGDWLRTGKRGIAELMISYKLKSVCKLAAVMKENGQDGAPIYKEVKAMCEKKRAKRARR